jgi:NADH-quinone oxidoreductase subunit M
VGAAVLLLIPKAEEQLIKLVALVTSLATLGIGIGILFEYDYDQKSGLQFALDRPKEWIGVINARYEIGIDGISLPLLLLSMVVVVLVILYSWTTSPSRTTRRRSSH